MILSKRSIIALQPKPIVPFVYEKKVKNGMSYGCSEASYDVRIKQALSLYPGEFSLASTLEYFKIPYNVAATVVDKSSWARQGLSAFNTFIDPGWQGYLTLELINNSGNNIDIEEGSPIVQIVFQWIDDYTEGYKGKYQYQPDSPVEYIDEIERIYN